MEKGRTVIRWIARVWSVASIGFILLILAGELFSPHAPPPTALRDLLGLFFFPFGTCVGMVLAWRWEGLGGAITVGSLLAFYATLYIADGQFPRGLFFLLVAAPGLLFLLSWGDHHHKQEGKDTLKTRTAGESKMITPLLTTKLYVPPNPAVAQAALRGILTKLWDLNLTLISVNRIESEGGTSNE